MEEIVRGFNYLINTGKAFYWGTSEWLASEIEEAWAVADRLGLIGPIVEQPGYSLLSRGKVDGEFKNAHLYSRRGLGLTVFSPLAGGLLTGKYVDGIPPDSRLAKAKDGYIQSVAAGVGNEKWNKEQESVKKLMKIAERLDTDVATLALAWVLKNPNVSSAITGASRPEQLWQTVRAVSVKGKLDQKVLEEIEEVMGNKPALSYMRFGE
jgi:aryl-alcohol dehydrogenase-like predicted oxidoreductase